MALKAWNPPTAKNTTLRGVAFAIAKIFACLNLLRGRSLPRKLVGERIPHPYHFASAAISATKMPAENSRQPTISVFFEPIARITLCAPKKITALAVLIFVGPNGVEPMNESLSISQCDDKTALQSGTRIALTPECLSAAVLTTL
ncbi:hypothetical protein D3C87_1545930 [compost metagenome]